MHTVHFFFASLPLEIAFDFKPCTTAGTVVNSGYRNFVDLERDPNITMKPTYQLLYVRDSWVALWKDLNELSLELGKNQRFWLHGVPGTGKSSLVWHWCLVYAQSHFENMVCWIHVKRGGGFISVVFEKGRIYWNQHKV